MHRTIGEIKQRSPVHIIGQFLGPTGNSKYAAVLELFGKGDDCRCVTRGIS